MATMREIGLGITVALQRSAIPEPLFIDLWNEHPLEAAQLVRAVLAECHDGKISLRLVRMPGPVHDYLLRDSSALIRPTQCRLESGDNLVDRIEFWRNEPE